MASTAFSAPGFCAPQHLDRHHPLADGHSLGAKWDDRWRRAPTAAARRVVGTRLAIDGAIDHGELLIAALQSKLGSAQIEHLPGTL